MATAMLVAAPLSSELALILLVGPNLAPLLFVGSDLKPILLEATVLVAIGTAHHSTAD